jgi:hypothetical protein
MYTVERKELRIENYELRITNYELRIANYELRIANYELRITNYELRITNYELRITNYEPVCLRQITNLTTFGSLRTCLHKADGQLLKLCSTKIAKISEPIHFKFNNNIKLNICGAKKFNFTLKSISLIS